MRKESTLIRRCAIEEVGGFDLPMRSIVVPALRSLVKGKRNGSRRPWTGNPVMTIAIITGGAVNHRHGSGVQIAACSRK